MLFYLWLGSAVRYKRNTMVKFIINRSNSKRHRTFISGHILLKLTLSVHEDTNLNKKTLLHTSSVFRRDYKGTTNRTFGYVFQL